jgi:hypothetical protein
MADEYVVIRKISKLVKSWRKGDQKVEREYYQFAIPRLWAKKAGLDKNPVVEVRFNGILKIIPKGEGANGD